MKRTLFVVMTIIIISAMILPALNINWGGTEYDVPEITPGSETESIIDETTLPSVPIVPKMCTLGSPFKEDWDLIICESFDTNTDLWEGTSSGATVSLLDGAYVVDNTDITGRIDPSTYVFPILVGESENVMLSVSGTMDCVEGECAWGVFVRRKDDEIDYIFMIDHSGKFTLTGLSPAEKMQELGNIQNGSHPSIESDGENTITAIAEGSQMMFYVNDQLLAVHKANNETNRAFGLIVWGGLGAKAVNRFESVLARGN